MHSARYAVDCSILFTELPLLERPAAARRAGFGAVEFWWPFDTALPSDAEVDAFEHAIRDAGVRLTGLNFAAGDMPGGDRGLVSWPQRSLEFRDNIAVTLGIGERLGCRAFNALYGNRVDGVRPEAQDDPAAENLALAATAAGSFSGVVLVEPVSAADRYPLRTAADAVAVIDRVQAESRIAHVQLADAPGKALRVFEPDDIVPALDDAKKLLIEHQVPVVVEVILERITNVSMGTEIDNVVEFEELADVHNPVPTASGPRRD